MLCMTIDRINKNSFIISILLDVLPHFYPNILRKQKRQSVFCGPNQMNIYFKVSHVNYKFWLKPKSELFAIHALKGVVINTPHYSVF